MERLFLLRHGIAVPPGTPGIADEDRALTPSGRRRTRQVARGLEALGLDVERIVTSPLRRARETAEIAAEALGREEALEENEALGADRSAESVAVWLGARSEASLLLVGHNPWISDLVGLLCTGSPRGSIELRKAGVAALTGRMEGGYSLDWLARPRLLRRLG
jgi:phosphohistidine phosphatase